LFLVYVFSSSQRTLIPTKPKPVFKT
jgi:hypothetical protein